MIRTVLELDLAGYQDIAVALEEALDIQAVRTFEDQIQAFVDQGLAAVELKREEVVLGTAGDNAVLVFESAEVMHRFAETVQFACQEYNAGKTTPLARRWFRMGAATGALEIEPEARRIIGTTVARAVRLEAASAKGALLVDQATHDALPEALRQAYGRSRTVHGKRDERYTAYQVQFIEPRWIEEPPRRRWLRWAAWVAVASVLAILGLGLAYHFRPGPPSPDPDPALQGTADIHIFNAEVAERNDRSISFPGLLPLQPGDEVQLQVHLKRPAFVYLLWITPSGQVTPVYPWKPTEWGSIEDERPISEYQSQPFPMKPDVEGREVFLALARTSPLPPDLDLKGILSRCVAGRPLPARNARSLVRFRDHGVEATLGPDRDPDFLLPTAQADPFRQLADRLQHELHPYFAFVDGAAFASQIAPP